MKKLICLLLVIVCVLGCTACGVGNKQCFDFNYTFNYAYIELPNGDVVDGLVESWKDYEGEQLQIKIDGITYLTSSFNAVLIYNPEFDK